MPTKNLTQNLNDVVAKYCLKCSLYGKEFHHMSKKMTDCVECYDGLAHGLEMVELIEKYKRR